MRPLFIAAVAAAQFFASCPRELTSDERLEREANTGPSKDPVSPADLGQISCVDASDGLAKVRVNDRDEAARLVAYMELYSSIKRRLLSLEEGLARDPDLRYRDDKTLVSAHEMCVQQQADVRLEFETFVRELVQVPIVEEVKGGNTIPVARLDFGTLRQAIEALHPDDEESLMSRVAGAEKKVAPGQGEPVKIKKKR